MFSSSSHYTLSVIIPLVGLVFAESSALSPRDTNLVIPWPDISALSSQPTALTSTVYYCTCGPSAITVGLDPTSIPTSTVQNSPELGHYVY
jgi:hypothetical protein